ncbi:MAG: glycoside hydrolase 100 family protein [Nonlabens sp.]|uniref:glycoside hydrolase 100 family protein n=1 Tax=Nonlabens sp. TaxID=1888209 RepID=UPI00321BB8B8
MHNYAYHKAIDLLKKASSEDGFLASALDISNYKRVWSRDGVICGIAALASGDQKLIETFEKTIETLAAHQHQMGTIPSNVSFKGKNVEISYGGLAGRVDAVTWFIIGVCQIAFYKNDKTYLHKYKTNIEKCLQLLNAWEFNNKHLVYVPLSGNWADEYITDGYVLYDQLLRLWALQSYNYFEKCELITQKITNIRNQVEINFLPDSNGEKFHEKAYKNMKAKDYAPASFSPSGYKSQFDAFANSLLLILDLGTDQFKNDIISYSSCLIQETKLKVLPAFWPPVMEQDEEWSLLKDNCKYEFRNFPYEFHNGGSWPMVNGFYGLALFHNGEKESVSKLLNEVNNLNAAEDFSFYENFNTLTGKAIGVAKCAWSAAAAVMLHQTLNNNFKLLID